MSELLEKALAGECGDDQRRIAEELIRWADLVLRKNADYGCAVWRRPLLSPSCDVGEAIRVRMSDKIERMISLLSKDPEVVTESYDDTVRDLGVYCLLLLAAPPEADMDDSVV